MLDLRTRKLNVTIAAIAMAAIIVGLFVAWAFGPVSAGTDDTVSFTVQPGWGGGRIASELRDAGLIRWTWAFIFFENWTHTGDRLQAGTYALSPGMTPAQIERIIATGAALSTDITLTIPEGMNVWEIDRLLLQKDITSAVGQFSGLYNGREGHLFPDTYRVPASASAGDVAARLKAEADVRLDGYTRRQVIIASILEKEAKTPEDMALVAGIIERRIARAMPLQVDATVAYGWCVRTKGFERPCDVTQAPLAAEIKVDGPYNTYTRPGLPSGPISNPGANALAAAAHPTESPYLYYLSTRDGSQLIYAKTLDEHLKNRLKYLGF